MQEREATPRAFPRAGIPSMCSVEIPRNVSAQVERNEAIPRVPHAGNDRFAKRRIAERRNFARRNFDSRDLAVMTNAADPNARVMHGFLSPIDLPQQLERDRRAVGKAR